MPVKILGPGAPLMPEYSPNKASYVHCLEVQVLTVAKVHRVSSIHLIMTCCIIRHLCICVCVAYVYTYIYSITLQDQGMVVLDIVH